MLLAPSARAHTIEGVALADLARQAGTIVEGHVRAVESAWNPARTQIYTTVTLRVAQYLKGGAGADQLQVRMLGGTVGDVTLAVLEQPTFRTDEDVVLFLAPTFGQGTFPLVAGVEGKFTETLDPVTRSVYLVSPGLAVPRSVVTDRVSRMNAGLPIDR